MNSPLGSARVQPSGIATDLISVAHNYANHNVDLIKNALLAKVPPADSVLSKPARYFLQRTGKLYRPLLTIVACELVGGTGRNALEGACSIEFIHSSSLILDDLPCMDNATTRRDQPCLHQQFGDAVAILTAVYFLNEAYQSATTMGSLGHEFLKILGDCVGDCGMVAGQVMDIQGGFNFDAVARLKTGALIKAAVATGALLGHASPEETQALMSYADSVGIAFQLRDDVIDGQADPTVQRYAQQLATQAAENLLKAFSESLPALTLAGMAMKAIQREG